MRRINPKAPDDADELVRGFHDALWHGQMFSFGRTYRAGYRNGMAYREELGLDAPEPEISDRGRHDR
jgi:hypothetical protein